MSQESVEAGLPAPIAPAEPAKKDHVVIIR